MGKRTMVKRKISSKQAVRPLYSLDVIVQAMRRGKLLERAYCKNNLRNIRPSYIMGSTLSSSGDRAASAKPSKQYICYMCSKTFDRARTLDSDHRLEHSESGYSMPPAGVGWLYSYPDDKSRRRLNAGRAFSITLRFLKSQNVLSNLNVNSGRHLLLFSLVT